MRVLVTGARLPAALEISAGLQSLGVEVFAADSLYFSPTGASRTISHYLRFPSPRFSFQAFRSTILSWVERYQIELIIPVSEEIFYLARLADELRPHCRLFSPSFQFLRACHSKWDILALAQACAIKVPHTKLVSSVDEALLAVKDLDKYILKPEFSRGAYEVLFDVHKLEQQHKSSTQARWLVQEYVSGQELCTYSIASEGRLLAHAAYEPAYRVGFGASLYFKPLEQAALREQVGRFVAQHAFSGQISFDFLRKADGELVLLECNPRATSGIHLVAQNEAWCRAFWGEHLPQFVETPLRARAAKFPMILLNSSQALRNNDFWRFLADLRGAKDTIFTFKNPWPFLALQLCSLELICRCWQWKIHPKNAYTYDLEWNGDED